MTSERLSESPPPRPGPFRPGRRTGSRQFEPTRSFTHRVGANGTRRGAEPLDTPKDIEVR